MKEKPVNQQALELLELAIMLGPEDEGIELDDQDYQLADLVALKNRISKLRGAADIVNRALSRYWKEHYAGEKYEQEHTRYWVGHSKYIQWADEGANAAFAEWLKQQPVGKIAGIVGLHGLRVTPMSQAERDTFLDETSQRARYPTIQSKPL